MPPLLPFAIEPLDFGDRRLTNDQAARSRGEYAYENVGKPPHHPPYAALVTLPAARRT